LVKAQLMRPSLLDTAHKYYVSFTVVFRSAHDDRPEWNWLWRRLRPGFQHVEVWKLDVDRWIRLDTALEFISLETYSHPPHTLIPSTDQPTFVEYQRLVRHGYFRQPFRFGPVTCVDNAAAVLGIRLPFWVRTPYQLYRLITREETEGRRSY
jgi:hypothetical protein